MRRNLQPLAFSVVRSSLKYSSSLCLGLWASFDFISWPKVPRNGTLLHKFAFARLAYTILINSFDDMYLTTNF
jgi:hypothetical protein